MARLVGEVWPRFGSEAVMGQSTPAAPSGFGLSSMRGRTTVDLGDMVAMTSGNASIDQGAKSVPVPLTDRRANLGNRLDA